MSTRDNEHRHPEWVPPCRCGDCDVCVPAPTIPANVILGSE